MRLIPIPAQDYQRTRWKNGLGWTREIHRAPTDGTPWDWRLSIAEVDQDGPFSAFPGVDREIVLLSGNGMRLDFDDGDAHILHPPHGALRFAGEQAVSAVLLEGPTQDYNVMWRRERYKVSVLHRPIVGPMVFFQEASVHWALYVLAGRLFWKDHAPKLWLEQGDSALLMPSEDSSRLILDGGGELLLVKFTMLS